MPLGAAEELPTRKTDQTINRINLTTSASPVLTSKLHLMDVALGVGLVEIVRSVP